MRYKPRDPITCTRCGTVSQCTCTFVVTTIDWKTRKGVCKSCDKKVKKETPDAS